MLALYKANCGLLRPVEIIDFDLVDNTIGIVFIRCYKFKVVPYDSVIPWDENAVDTEW